MGKREPNRDQGENETGHLEESASKRDVYSRRMPIPAR